MYASAYVCMCLTGPGPGGEPVCGHRGLGEGWESIFLGLIPFAKSRRLSSYSLSRVRGGNTGRFWSERVIFSHSPLAVFCYLPIQWIITWGWLGNICGMSGGYLGHIWKISRGYFGDKIDIYWGFLGDILGISWGYMGNILGISSKLCVFKIEKN